MKMMAPPICPLVPALLIAFGLAPTARAEDPAPRFDDYMKACVEVNHFNGTVLVSNFSSGQLEAVDTASIP